MISIIEKKVCGFYICKFYILLSSLLCKKGELKNSVIKRPYLEPVRF